MKSKIVSNNIADFVSIVKEYKSRYRYCKEQLSNCDKATQDILHKLERGTDKNEKNRLATQLKYIRKDRRYYKDIIEELEPFVKIFDDGQRMNFFNEIQQSVGAIRKEESYHAERHYNPRVLKDLFNENYTEG